MSGRAAPPSPHHPPANRAGLLLALGLFAGAGLAAAPQQDAKSDGVDERSPLPAHDPAGARAEKFRLPNRDAATFRGRTDKNGNRLPNTGIEDFEPVASEKKNPDEYRAWTTVVQWAKQDGFTAAELERVAARDATRDDLLNSRSALRLELLRLDGRLTKVRRVAASRSLAEEGTAEVYEALLVPVDEPPDAAVAVAFTELPAGLAGVGKVASGEWLGVDQWASAAGWFFKVAKDDAPGSAAIPLLVGRSVTLHKELPPQPGATPENPAGLDRELRVFRRIRDNAPIAKAEDNWEEVSAWSRVLLHARRFTPEELERYAAGVKFADLFTDNRRDYKLDLVKFEGRLVKLDPIRPNDKLRAAGVEGVYEGWLVPKDEPRGNPVCVVFTDPPEGVEPVGRVNKWVSFAGYSFKLLWYKSGERDKDDPNKNVLKKAPLLLGRAVINRPDPDAPGRLSWGAFANAATLAVLGLLAVVGGLTWWYRRGDRRARQEVRAHRGRNPFGTAEAPGN